MAWGWSTTVDVVYRGPVKVFETGTVDKGCNHKLSLRVLGITFEKYCSAVMQSLFTYFEAAPLVEENTAFIAFHFILAYCVVHPLPQ